MPARRPAGHQGRPGTAATGSGAIDELERFRRVVETRVAVTSLLDVGDGPAALFVHGVGTNAHLWRHVIRAVAGPARRCVAIDLPLHGRSPLDERQPCGLDVFADIVDAVCGELGLDAVDLVGNDTGGAIAQVVAARHQERVRTLTLTNCETHDNLPPPGFKSTVVMARLGMLHRTGPRLVRRPERARRRIFGAGYECVEDLPLDVVRSFLEPVLGSRDRAIGFERWISSLRAADLLAAEPGLRRLAAPALVVWGTGDRFFHVKWAHWLQDTLPNVSDVVTLPGARLFFPDERGEELAALLAAHWRDHAGPLAPSEDVPTGPRRA
jgi:pimeloyl-ACP methyl ester carboxylesterase